MLGRGEAVIQLPLLLVLLIHDIHVVCEVVVRVVHPPNTATSPKPPAKRRRRKGVVRVTGGAATRPGEPIAASQTTGRVTSLDAIAATTKATSECAATRVV